MSSFLDVLDEGYEDVVFDWQKYRLKLGNVTFSLAETLVGSCLKKLHLVGHCDRTGRSNRDVPYHFLDVLVRAWANGLKKITNFS